MTRRTFLAALITVPVAALSARRVCRCGRHHKPMARDDFERRYIAPAALALAKHHDEQLLAAFGQAYGLPGKPITISGVWE